MSIPAEIRLRIFTLILGLHEPFGEDDSNGILEFLNEIWDLKTMPSTDSRFSDAEKDIIQHTINNFDWDYEYLLKERLNLINADDKLFIKFLETVVLPKFRNSIGEIIDFVEKVNRELKGKNLHYNLTDYDQNDLPIYTIVKLDPKSPFPFDIFKNNIPFFVVKNPTGRSNLISSHYPPKVYPAFKLVLNNGWNDYGIVSSFSLFFYESKESGLQIGEVKIIHKQYEIADIIPDEFYFLDENFCSLGESFDFYEELNKIFGNRIKSVLWSLRDSALFYEIQEEFENESKFKDSLIRGNEAERALREVKHIISGADLNNLYSFNYKFHPKFSENAISVNFNFGKESLLPNRVYAIIGKNGAGKTQLITSLPMEISNGNLNFFEPHIPIFSKIIAVSYSVFDQFDLPRKSTDFNYVYCGLRNLKGDLLDEKALLLRFHKTRKKIFSRGMVKEWREVLFNLLEPTVVKEFIDEDESGEFSFVNDGFKKVRKELSSGQSIILYIISQIIV